MSQHIPNLRLDQHFLTDKSAIDAIIAAAKPKKTEAILEIGPGTGNTTAKLPQERLTLVEKDSSLIADLREKFPKANIIEGDGIRFLKTNDFFDLIISNLPYSICEPFFQILAKKDFERGIFLVPEHFATMLKERNTKFGLIANAYFEIEVLDKISKDCFYPKPKVHSYIIRLIKKKPKGPAEAVIRSLHGQRDKKVKNALREHYCRQGKTKKQANEIVDAMQLGDLSLKLAEKLSYEELKLISEKAL